MRVLVVDDEPAVRESLERSLRFEGYDVVTAADGVEALTVLPGQAPDIVVLDVLMPYLNGFETCRRLRAAGYDVPVLMLTARDATRDRVAGLDAGADDYLPKPFDLDELLARLRALLRRGGALRESDGILAYSDLRADLRTRTASRDGVLVELTRTEFDLLTVFLTSPRRVLTRAYLMHEVWGMDHDAGTNVLDVYVRYLRRKTEANGLPRLIHTVRAVGFVLREAR